MKLVMCRKCGDIFNLRKEEKTCSCGQARGKYIDNVNAQVTEACISIAIGNGSFHTALWDCQRYSKRDDVDRGYFRVHCGVMCWIRPNEGNGNPHTSVISNTGGESETEKCDMRELREQG